MKKSLYGLVEELSDLSYREGKLSEYKMDWSRAEEEKWEKVVLQVAEIKQEILDRIHDLENNLETIATLLKNE